MKTVALFGTFDFLHAGHIFVLEEAKKLGDKLIVIIAQDHIVEELKGNKPIHDQSERRNLVAQLAIVDEALIGDTSLGGYEVLRQVTPAIVAIGYDQQELFDDVSQFIANHGLTMLVSRLPEYEKPGRKTGKLREAFGV